MAKRKQSKKTAASSAAAEPPLAATAACPTPVEDEATVPNPVPRAAEVANAPGTPEPGPTPQSESVQDAVPAATSVAGAGHDETAEPWPAPTAEPAEPAARPGPGPRASRPRPPGPPPAEASGDESEPAPPEASRLEVHHREPALRLRQAARALRSQASARRARRQEGHRRRRGPHPATPGHRHRGRRACRMAGSCAPTRTTPPGCPGCWSGRPMRLSRAMLETLSIVAYRQPVTRPEIDDIRGVDCGPVLKTLLDRGLVRIIGKKEEVGRPILYGTTPEFLRVFNLRELAELPTLREFYDLTAEDQSRVEAEHGPRPSPPPSATSPKPEVALRAVARERLAAGAGGNRPPARRARRGLPHGQAGLGRSRAGRRREAEPATADKTEHERQPEAAPPATRAGGVGGPRGQAQTAETAGAGRDRLAPPRRGHDPRGRGHGGRQGRDRARHAGRSRARAGRGARPARARPSRRSTAFCSSRAAAWPRWRPRPRTPPCAAHSPASFPTSRSAGRWWHRSTSWPRAWSC